MHTCHLCYIFIILEETFNIIAFPFQQSTWDRFNKETTSVFYKWDPCFNKFTKNEFNKSVYKFLLQASNLYYSGFYGIQFLQVETLHVNSAIAKKYTSNFFIEFTPEYS